MNDKTILERELETRWRAGDFSAAQPVAEKLLEMDSENLLALQFLAKTTLQKKDYSATIPLWKKLKEISPPHWEIFAALAQAEELSGNVEGAIATCRQGLKALEGDYLLLFILGSLFQKVGFEKKATTAFYHCVHVYYKLSGRTDPVLKRRLAANKSQIEFATKHLDASLNQAYKKAVREFAEKKGVSCPIASKARYVRYAEFPITPNPLFQPKGFYAEGLEERPWFEREEFDWVEKMEAHFGKIRQEVVSRLDTEADLIPYLRAGQVYEGDLQKLAGNKDWGALYFFDSGKKVEENHRRFPYTSKVLEDLPLFKIDGQNYEAFFSVLKPGTRIAPHFGISNIRLTCHLPLVVPGKCFLKAGSETRRMEEGKCLIFDDSFTHEAWNDSEGPRIVFIFEAWKPDLSDIERQALEEGMKVEADWYAQRIYRSVLTD